MTKLLLAHWQAFKAPKLLDPYLLLAMIALMMFGLVLVSTSSINYASVNMGNPWHFMNRQLVFLFITLLLCLVVLAIPSDTYYRWSTPLLLVGFVLLGLVLLPGVGVSVNGSRRWLPFGLFNVQSSEVAKLTLVLFLSAYLTRHQQAVLTSFWAFIKPLLVMSLYAGLVIVQPDWGATAILVGATGVMLFLAGARLAWFALTMVLICVLMYLAIHMEGYRVQRLLSFRDPWAAEHMFGSGYQLTQALIGVGRGGWWGQGLGNSVQKLAFLPEAHTDFIFAIAGEELGFLGHSLLMLLFVLLIWRVLSIGWQAQQVGKGFQASFCFGIATVFALQFMVNIGVNIGLLPTKGLTLPFISYGGASLMISAVMIMICQRIHHELVQESSNG